MTKSDLHVEPISHALADKCIELIVTGSIGAIESVRFIRALRRLGATVRVTLSEGGAQFVTPLALEWASAQPVQTHFSGTASHVASGDVCVVAPASANFLRKLAAGITDTPSAALATSYSGSGKPMIVLPNMHSSMAHAPAVRENLAQVARWGVIVEAREEEGKHKFPDPAGLANLVAHHTNRRSSKVLVAFGGTKGFIDDVRYIGNYSSGSLGTQICEELYRRGFFVTGIAGTAEVLPQSISHLQRVNTNQELEQACLQALATGHEALVFAAAVLDYVPAQVQPGKIRSDQESLAINLVRTDKIIAKLHPMSGIKVGFKLEPGSASTDNERTSQALQIANDYCPRYDLSLLVVNQLDQISASHHAAHLVDGHNFDHITVATSKREIAAAIADHIERGLA